MHDLLVLWYSTASTTQDDLLSCKLYFMNTW